MATEKNTTIVPEQKSLRALLSGNKFSVDYFQREYSWGKGNIEELISDLVTAFKSNHRPDHSPANAKEYDSYYMGPIVICNEAGVNSIIDGQQRITSLTLLLMYLNHYTDSQNCKQHLASMIYSDSFGNMSFNLQVPGRELCLSELFRSGQYNIDQEEDASVRNMVERYRDIEELFPKDDLPGDAMTTFIYWLIEKVYFIQITSGSKDNAYTIFESMNNRGLPLTSADMLKGFVLSKFKSDASRDRINQQWRDDMVRLDGDISQFFQAWLRSQYAEKLHHGTIDNDFETIGSRFHNWFRDNYNVDGPLKDAIGGDIERFMGTHYRFYMDRYLLARRASAEFKKETEHIYYNGCYGISPYLCFPMYLAPLCVGEDEATSVAKMNIVARAIDNFVTRRSINYRMFSPSSIRYTMYNHIKAIRGASIEDLKRILNERMEKDYDFSTTRNFFLHGTNGRFVKYYLCRLTAFVEENCGMGHHFVDLFVSPGSNKQEIEHIWSDHPEWHTDDCADRYEFDRARNTIGDLVLLPNGANQSYNDMPSEEKIARYKENMLAISLNQSAYTNNPTFAKFIQTKGLAFHPYTEWRKKHIEERCDLYQQLSELIWPSKIE